MMAVELLACDLLSTNLDFVLGGSVHVNTDKSLKDPMTIYTSLIAGLTLEG
jgi:hypothetical protein